MGVKSNEKENKVFISEIQEIFDTVYNGDLVLRNG